jgi:hypothetical protein
LPQSSDEFFDVSSSLIGNRLFSFGYTNVKRFTAAIHAIDIFSFGHRFQALNQFLRAAKLGDVNE